MVRLLMSKPSHWNTMRIKDLKGTSALTPSPPIPNTLYPRFHSETRILTTLFGLLFWDIIFADIPGAFETAFQSAPLDMFEDSFFYARKGLIDTRLSELREGTAREILQRHDDMYREKKTWCLCVSWDVCSKEDLVEVVEVCCS